MGDLRVRELTILVFAIAALCLAGCRAAVQEVSRPGASTVVKSDVRPQHSPLDTKDPDAPDEDAPDSDKPDPLQVLFDASYGAQPPGNSGRTRVSGSGANDKTVKKALRTKADIESRVREIARDLAKKHPAAKKLRMCYDKAQNEWWFKLYEDGGAFYDMKQYVWNVVHDRLEPFLVEERLAKEKVALETTAPEPNLECRMVDTEGNGLRPKAVRGVASIKSKAVPEATVRLTADETIRNEQPNSQRVGKPDKPVQKEENAHAGVSTRRAGSPDASPGISAPEERRKHAAAAAGPAEREPPAAKKDAEARTSGPLSTKPGSTGGSADPAPTPPARERPADSRAGEPPVSGPTVERDATPERDPKPQYRQASFKQDPQVSRPIRPPISEKSTASMEKRRTGETADVQRSGVPQWENMSPPGDRSVTTSPKAADNPVETVGSKAASVSRDQGLIPGASPTCHVFAYGTKINHAELLAWLEFNGYDPSDLVDASPAVLDGHDFVWNYYSSSRGGGAVNIEPRSGCGIWGLLLEIRDPLLDALDRREGHPEAYSRGDRRMAVKRLEDGKTVYAWVYRASPNRDKRRNVWPTRTYKQKVLEAATFWGFPGEYLAKIKGWQTQ
ncbi:MAG: gamma-glutamylcyclotransferase [Pseudomonadota bacterium]